MVRWWQPGTAILDVGCNLGQMSICVARASQLIGGMRTPTRVYSIEARSLLAKLAAENMALNEVDGFVIHGAAWSQSDLRLPLDDVDLSAVGSVGSLGVASDSRVSQEHAPSVVLDSLRFDRPVSVMKLDIQGSELEALRGSTQLIERDSPVIIFEFEELFAPRFMVTFADYVDFLNSLGYKIREVVGSNNYVAIRDSIFWDRLAATFERRRRRMDMSLFLQLAQGVPLAADDAVN